MWIGVFASLRVRHMSIGNTVDNCCENIFSFVNARTTFFYVCLFVLSSAIIRMVEIIRYHDCWYKAAANPLDIRKANLNYIDWIEIRMFFICFLLKPRWRWKTSISSRIEGKSFARFVNKTFGTQQHRNRWINNGECCCRCCCLWRMKKKDVGLSIKVSLIFTFRFELLPIEFAYLCSMFRSLQTVEKPAKWSSM